MAHSSGNSGNCGDEGNSNSKVGNSNSNSKSTPSAGAGGHCDNTNTNTNTDHNTNANDDGSAKTSSYVFGSENQGTATISGYDADDSVTVSTSLVSSHSGTSGAHASGASSSVALFKYVDADGDTVGVSEVVGKTSDKFVLCVHEGDKIEKIVLTVAKGDTGDTIKFNVADGSHDDTITIGNGTVTHTASTPTPVVPVVTASSHGCLGDLCSSHVAVNDSDPCHHGAILV